MHKFNKNAGYGLLEVIISLAIIVIFFNIIFNLKVKSVYMQSYNIETSKYIEIIEILKNKLTFNYEYNDIVNLANLNGNISEDTYLNRKLYINNNNLNLENIKSKEPFEIFTSEKDDKLPNLELSIEEIDEGVMKLNLEIYFKTIDKYKKISTSFCKGDY